MRHSPKLPFVALLTLAALCWGTENARAESRLIAAGTTVVVRSPQAQLMVGNKAVAPLGRGSRLNVTEVRGPWLATWVDHQGEWIGGWVWAPFVEREVSRRDSAEPHPPKELPAEDHSYPFSS